MEHILKGYEKKSNWLNDLALRFRCCSKSSSLRKIKKSSTISLSSSYYDDDYRTSCCAQEIKDVHEDFQDSLTADSPNSYMNWNNNFNNKNTQNKQTKQFTRKPHHIELFESILNNVSYDHNVDDDDDNHIILDVPNQISFLNDESIQDDTYRLDHDCYNDAVDNYDSLNCKSYVLKGENSSLYQWSEKKLNNDFTKTSIRSVLGIYYKNDLSKKTNFDDFLAAVNAEKLDSDVIFFGNFKHLMNLFLAFGDAWSKITNHSDSNDLEMIASLPAFDFTNNYNNDDGGGGVVEMDVSIDNDHCYGDLRQQQVDNATIVTSLDQLYESAEMAKEPFHNFAKRMEETCGIPIRVEPSLKDRDRAYQKMKDNYSTRPGPAASWLLDIVRGRAICSSVKDIVRLWETIMEDEYAVVVRLKNRCVTPRFNGHRDLLLNIRLPIGNNKSFHICELQIQFQQMANIDKRLHSHITYEFFRSYFKTNSNASTISKNQLDVLLEYGGDVESAERFVDNALIEADYGKLCRVKKILKMLYRTDLVKKVSQKLTQIKDEEFKRKNLTLKKVSK
jgi:hypothetical protein